MIRFEEARDYFIKSLELSKQMQTPSEDWESTWLNLGNSYRKLK